MLKYFKVKNFRSIRETEIDFTFAEGKAPPRFRELGYHVFLEGAKERVVPCMTIFGANASGKTNIVKAISNLREVILGKELPQAYDPNLIQDSDNYIEYELSLINFELNFDYKIKFNSELICNESLTINGNNIFTIENGYLITENINIGGTYTSEKIKEIFSIEAGGNAQIAPFVHIIYTRYPGLSLPLKMFYKSIKDILIFQQQGDFSIDTLLASLPNDFRKVFEEKLIEILKKFDFDIEDITFSNTPPYSHKTIHKTYDGRNILLDLKEESYGTQILIYYLSIVLFSLTFGQSVIVDELDRAMHPFILSSLFDMYKDVVNNKNNAQLIFTTHTTDILENPRLRPSEIGIVNKSKKTGTNFKRVSSFEGIRNVNNFRKQYCEGKFTGIPFPYL